MHYHATRSHVSFPLLPRPTGCQHQCLTSWESSRRPPEPPPAQSCGPLNIHHLQGRDPEVLHLLSYTWHQPLARNQAFHQPVCCLSKPNTPGQHHSGVPQTKRAILRDLLLRGWYDTSKYNTHSLRTGAATAAARAGLPSSTIQRLGRWSSAAYTTYTRHPLTLPSDTATVASAYHTYTHTHNLYPHLYCHLKPISSK